MLIPLVQNGWPSVSPLELPLVHPDLSRSSFAGQHGGLILLIPADWRNYYTRLFCTRDSPRDCRLFNIGSKRVLQEAGHAVAVFDCHWCIRKLFCHSSQQNIESRLLWLLATLGRVSKFGGRLKCCILSIPLGLSWA